MHVMEINLDIIFLVLFYVMYRWGKKNGIAEGKREAYREERLYRMEEKFDEWCEKKNSE